MQSNLGWSHELTSDMVISADYVNSLGRDLNLRPRVNQRIPGSLSNPRRVSALLPSPLNPNTNAHPPDGQPRQERVQRVDPQPAPPLLARHGLQRQLHPAEGHQHDRPGGRRAEHREHPGSEQPVRRSPSARSEPDDRLAPPDQPQRDVPAAVGHSASRRSSSSARRCRWRWSMAATSTSTATPRKFRRTAYAVDSFDASKPQLQQVTVEGDRHLRHGQLRPRLLSDADERAPLEAVPPRRPRQRRGDRRDLQPVQQHQPERLPHARDRSDDGAPQMPTLLQPATYSGDFRRPEQRVGQLGLRFTF